MAELGSGFSLAGYRIESLLGSGSMGSVYSGRSTSSSTAAWRIKVLLPELARDERFRERFLRESRLAAGARAPERRPRPRAPARPTASLYLAMRYVDGRDLAAMLARSAGSTPSASLRRPRPGRRARSTRRTRAGSCTATSSPPTS